MAYPELPEAKQAEIRLELLEECGTLLSELRNLDSLLERAEIWAPLCNSNDAAASIGSFHGPCFTEAAFQVGMKFYKHLLVVAAPDALTFNMTVDELPRIDEGAFDTKLGINGLLTYPQEFPDFDRDLAIAQLSKECWRARGKPEYAIIRQNRQRNGGPGRPANKAREQAILEGNLSPQEIARQFKLTADAARQARSRANKKATKNVTE
jgi:hypothetical protein